MPKGQDLSRHQQKIVKRYYHHIDTITLTRLGEIVSDLYLAEGKAADRLWARADTALKKTDMPAAKRESLITSRDVKALAEVVNKLSAPG